MNLKEQYKLIEFVDLGDERGNLVVIEGEGMDIISFSSSTAWFTFASVIFIIGYLFSVQSYDD